MHSRNKWIRSSERSAKADVKLRANADRARVIVAMLGARMHYAVPRILCEAHILERFYTDSYAGNKHWLTAILEQIPKRLRPAAIQRWLGRKESALPSGKVVSFELFGWRYGCRRYFTRDEARIVQLHASTGRSFNQRIIASDPPRAHAVWGYDGASLELFRWAKGNGIRCILEQAIAPRRVQQDILSEELERWPGWQPRLQTMSYPDPLSEREESEWGLADCIVAGSAFVAKGLQACGATFEKIHVVPYGVDERLFQFTYRARPSGRMRLLFAGEVGLRKGVPYLLEALRRIGTAGVEAQFAGHLNLAPAKIAPFNDIANFLGPVPRIQMQALFRWADVLVLPSVCEGSATVTYEALMSGVPVITTPNAGSVVQDRVDGFIVPVRDADALANAIALYSEDRALLAQHQAATKESGRRAGLGRYQADIVRLVQDVVEH